MALRLSCILWLVDLSVYEVSGRALRYTRALRHREVNQTEEAEDQQAPDPPDLPKPVPISPAARAALFSGNTIFDIGKRTVVEERTAFITPIEFFDEFAKEGKPVVFRGAAKTMPAFRHWRNDSYLEERFGDRFLNIEVGEENSQVTLDAKLREFTEHYRESPLYAKEGLPRAMAQHVYLLPMLNCGGHQAAMSSASIWWSNHVTRSKIHMDDFDNFNCAFRGSKRFALWGAKHRNKIQKKKMGWTSNIGASGAPSSAGKINVSKVDVMKFPGWKDVEWFDVTVHEGDCLFIPEDWAHSVWGVGDGPFLNVNVWWGSPTVFDNSSCYRLEERGFDQMQFLSTLRDCNYADYDEKATSVTHCLARNRLPSGEETDRRFYTVTGWCDSDKHNMPEFDVETSKHVLRLQYGEQKEVKKEKKEKKEKKKRHEEL